LGVHAHPEIIIIINFLKFSDPIPELPN